MTKENTPALTAVTTSPRRQELLRRIFPGVVFIPPQYSEKKRRHSFTPVLLSLYHAYQKLKSAGKQADTAVAFDTIVYRDFRIYSKPETAGDVREILRALKNKTHKVVTGIAIKKKRRVYFSCAVTKVTFKDLSRTEIRDYAESSLWPGKAGGYGIQDIGNDLIKEYKGDYFNVMGVPLYLLRSLK
ncbi:MAG: Maf family protein [bacterium]|nr:Maf family protein [bacterium]